MALLLVHPPAALGAVEIGAALLPGPLERRLDAVLRAAQFGRVILLDRLLDPLEFAPVEPEAAAVGAFIDDNPPPRRSGSGEPHGSADSSRQALLDRDSGDSTSASIGIPETRKETRSWHSLWPVLTPIGASWTGPGRQEHAFCRAFRLRKGSNPRIFFFALAFLLGFPGFLDVFSANHPETIAPGIRRNLHLELVFRRDSISSVGGNDG
jgi:hypothetical protein